MTKLLVEIFSEEVPVKEQYNCLLKLKQILSTNLNSSHIRSVISPRHMCFEISNLEMNQSIEIKGPKVSAEQALQGFIQKHKIKNIDELVVRDGIYFLERILSQEESLAEISNQLLTSLKSMVWLKSMTWGDYNLQWIRPIHAITCMIDDKILPVELEHIKSSNITYGHRSKNSPKIHITSADLDKYITSLRAVGVIVSQEERRESILNQISKLIKPLKLTMIEDNELLDEVVGLVENPKVFLGQIHSDFMSLPREVLITSLKNNQKYLLLNDECGNLAPYFVIVSDIDPEDGGKAIIYGNEKVLSARLSDAKHFIKTDLQKDFADLTEKLHKIQFHKDVGSLYEKTIRIREITRSICVNLSINSTECERAATLCKNDLVTQMVSEFPELQGVVGYYYSKTNGESDFVAFAIRDHYKPCGPNDLLPATLEGCILAIADKLDTLISLFNIGIKPTSTKDPYALRRAALGILRIILSQEILTEKIILQAPQEVIVFMSERARHLYKGTELETILAILNRKIS